MKLRDIDLQQLNRDDIRLRAIKERRFDELGYDAPIIGILIAYFTACCVLLGISLTIFFTW